MTNRRLILDEFGVALAAGERARRCAARALVGACEAGDVDVFLTAVDAIGQTVDGCRA